MPTRRQLTLACSSGSDGSHCGETRSLPASSCWNVLSSQAGRLAPGDESAAANALGRGYVMQSRYDEAFAIFARFLDEARKRGDHFDEVRFAVLLANAYIDHGDYGRAHATLGEVLELARRTVDPLLQASLYWSQSRAFLSQGEADRAAEYGRLALATLRASEQTLEAARVLQLLAFIENDRGNPDAALELHRRR